MKIIDTFIIILAIMSISIIACNPQTKIKDIDFKVPNKEQADSTRKADSLYKDRNDYIERNKNGVRIFTIDSHEYIYINRDLMFHNQNCPNPKHIR